jgi:hypothetical protein
MALIRIHKEHDLVLEFGYPGERKKFLAKLENFLSVRVSVQNLGGRKTIPGQTSQQDRTWAEFSTLEVTVCIKCPYLEANQHDLTLS